MDHVFHFLYLQSFDMGEVLLAGEGLPLPGLTNSKDNNSIKTCLSHANQPIHRELAPQPPPLTKAHTKALLHCLNHHKTQEELWTIRVAAPSDS